MAIRINPIGMAKTFDINGAHISVREAGSVRTLRTLGTPEFEASWYDEPHKNVMRLVYELEKALLVLDGTRFCKNHPDIRCLSDYDYCADCWDMGVREKYS